MTVDLRSILIVAAVISAVTSLSLLTVRRSYSDNLRQSVRYWASGLAAVSVALPLFAGRGTVPDILSVFFSNVLLAYALISVLKALRTLRGQVAHRAGDVVSVAAVTLGIAAFMWVWPSLTARVVLFGVFVAITAVRATREIMRFSNSQQSRSNRLLVSSLALLLGLIAIRVVNQLLGTALNDFLQPGPLQIATFMAFAAFPAVATLGFMLMINDHLTEALERLAVEDPLTKLFNRRYVDRVAERWLPGQSRKARPFCALVIDADHFKRINDTCGHAAGDEVLRFIAKHLREEAREDDVVGRIGGEEFLVLLADVAPSRAADVAERIRSRIANQPCMGETWSVPVTVSIGVASLNPDKPSLRDVLQRADDALYRAKQAGRNRVEVAD